MRDTVGQLAMVLEQLLEPVVELRKVQVIFGDPHQLHLGCEATLQSPQSTNWLQSARKQKSVNSFTDVS